MKFNINNYVYVKLTPLGLSILEKEHKERFSSVSYTMQFQPLYKFEPPKVDLEGWSEWQLWDLMSVFGPHLHNGMRLMFETTIKIPESKG